MPRSVKVTGMKVKAFLENVGVGVSNQHLLITRKWNLVTNTKDQTQHAIRSKIPCYASTVALYCLDKVHNNVHVNILPPVNLYHVCVWVDYALAT